MNYQTPDGLFEVSTNGLAEGERRKEDRLDLLRERRAVYVRRGQRALLSKLLKTGIATADDVAAAVELPPEIDGRCLGAVPGTLARLGLVALVGYEKSARPNRHASPQAVWTLNDREAAVRWLEANQDLPDLANDDCDACRQLTMTFDQCETPTVAAAGVSF
jgi:hypothetical protein